MDVFCIVHCAVLFCSVRQRHNGTKTQTHRDETQRHRGTETERHRDWKERKGMASRERKECQGRAGKGRKGKESKKGLMDIGARLLPQTACGMTPPIPPALTQQKTFQRARD